MKVLKGYKSIIEKIQEMDLIDTESIWKVLYSHEARFDIPSIPVMAGGIDHIDVFPKQIIIHDRGCNGKDNSVILRR